MGDSQFTIITTLQPIDAFEAAYQGQPAGVPIAFPGGQDEGVADDLIAPNLQKGTPVPFGAEIVLWIPFCAGFDADETLTEQYEYQVIWRMRNVRDFRQTRRPYHMPRQTAGVPDTGAVPSARSVIPAADWAAGRQAAPVYVTDTGTTLAEYSSNRIVPRAGNITAGPIGTDGVTQNTLTQGIFDPVAQPGIAGDPLFNPVFLGRAPGDEMIILARRVNQGGGNWDFTAAGAGSGIDFPFSNVYGTRDGQKTRARDVGIYVAAGTPGQSTIPIPA